MTRRSFATQGIDLSATKEAAAGIGLEIPVIVSAVMTTLPMKQQLDHLEE